jgi:hypothetical protein
MELTREQQAIFAAVLESLLPGAGAWPGAPALGLEADAWRLAATVDGHVDTVRTTLDELGPEFASLDASEREARLRALEAGDPARFAVLKLLAYDAYYTHPAVLAVLEQRCGYPARPPQPDGHELEPFDESRLHRQRQREPFWRTP